MFETEVMKEFRQTHDCRDMDAMGAKPLFIFRIYERLKGKWIEGDFYADTPLEALDQAHDEGIGGLLLAKRVGACNYFYDRLGEAHTVLTLDLVQRIAGGLFFQSLNPPQDIFRERVIERRKEMREENIL